MSVTIHIAISDCVLLKQTVKLCTDLSKHGFSSARRSIEQNVAIEAFVTLGVSCCYSNIT